MNKEVLILKNITREGPGLLEVLLKEKGIKYRVVDLTGMEDETHAGFFVLENYDLENLGALVVCGGPDSANDQNFKILNESKFVRRVVEAGIPYVGICLGMQILVKVCGGEVLPSPYKEVGFRDHQSHPFEVIMLTHEGEHDPLFAEMGENFRVFQLHGETVKFGGENDLGSSGSLIQKLAIGRLVKNQVVKVGDCAYGIQCHFELTPEMFEQWINEDPDLLKLDQVMLRSEFEAIREEYLLTGQKLFANFLRIAGY